MPLRSARDIRLLLLAASKKRQMRWALMTSRDAFDVRGRSSEAQQISRAAPFSRARGDYFLRRCGA